MWPAGRPPPRAAAASGPGSTAARSRPAGPPRGHPSDAAKPQPQPSGRADSLKRIEVHAQRRRPRRGDAVGMAPVVSGQRLDQAESLEPVQRTVERARTELDAGQLLDVLDERVTVLGTVGEADQ